jgi:hypothetical protein
VWQQISAYNVPHDTQEERTSDDDGRQPDDFVQLHVHNGSQNGVVFRLFIVANGFLQPIIIIILDILLKPINIQQLKQPWHSQQLDQPEQSCIVFLWVRGGRVPIDEQGSEGNDSQQVKEARAFYVMNGNLFDVCNQAICFFVVVLLAEAKDEVHGE